MLSDRQKQIYKVYKDCKGNCSEASKILGISRQGVSKTIRTIKAQSSRVIKSKTKNILFMSDMHAPYHHRDTLAFYKAIKSEFDLTDIKNVGDIVDNHMMSYHEYETEALGPREEYEEAKKTLKEVEKLFPEMTVSTGNHCFTKETEVRTQRGWLPVAEVTEADSILSMDENENSYWGTVDKVHEFDYEGQMLNWKSQVASLQVTPGHRVYHKSHGKYEGKVVISYAKDLASTFSLPCAANNTQPDISVSDDEIRLWGWLMTTLTMRSRVEL